jgi:hypothetical protein
MPEHRNGRVSRQAGPLSIGWVREARVRELVRTNDEVLLSAVKALLQSANIPHLVLDENMSVLEGSLGILPRRVLVAEEHVRSARRLLKDAGLAHELSPDGP